MKALAADFVNVGGPYGDGRALNKQPKPNEIDDFYSWGALVRSPVHATKASTVSSLSLKVASNPMNVRGR